jgi:glyoxylase-like metal-dependent hydrolase (beta-lactamase superfamily II)
MRTLSLLTAAVVLLFTGATRSFAQQQQSPVQKSFQQAQKELEEGILAIGGLEALQGIEDITREISGTRHDEGQGMQPVLPRVVMPPAINHPRIKSIRDIRGQRTFDELQGVIFGGQPLNLRAILAGNAAFTVSEISRFVRTLPSASVGNARAQRFRRYPESLLLTAWNRPETLRWVGEADFEGRKQRVISFADSDGAEVALYFDALSHLLTKTELLGDDPILGDITLETVYADWRPVEKLTLPFRITDKIDGVVQQDLRVSSVALNTHPPESLFTLPDGYAKIEPPSPVPTAKKLADDVYAILGPYNSLAVVFKDYVLVVEAGANSRYSQAVIAEIRKVAAGKPLRYLVSTHFHFDHLGGVRSFIAEGATIVTSLSARSVIERAAAAPHLMRPDALSRRPRAASFEIIEGRRVFDDGLHRVELYKIASPHVGEMIIAYLPKEKILLEGDMLDLPEAGIPPAGDDTADLAEQIQKLGLNVETIIPVHGRMGSLADLQQALAARAAKK